MWACVNKELGVHKSKISIVKKEEINIVTIIAISVLC